MPPMHAAAGPAPACADGMWKPFPSHTHLALQFMASPENRSRYWARSFAGWVKFGSVKPNAAHDSIARLQQGGACWQLLAACPPPAYVP